MFRKLSLLVMVLAFGLAFSMGCSEESSTPEVQRGVEDAAKSAERAAQDAATATERAAEDAAGAVENAME